MCLIPVGFKLILTEPPPNLPLHTKCHHQFRVRSLFHFQPHALLYVLFPCHYPLIPLFLEEICFHMPLSMSPSLRRPHLSLFMGPFSTLPLLIPFPVHPRHVAFECSRTLIHHWWASPGRQLAVVKISRVSAVTFQMSLQKPSSHWKQWQKWMITDLVSTCL